MPTRILLADDSVTIQKVVELTFSDGDYEVTATTNGAKAIEMIQSLRPDIILSDIIMPEKNGYEVCEFVKSHPELRTIPVILLTGTFEPFDPDRAEKAGCDAVVTKPFESQSLIQKVDELTRASSAQAAADASPPAPSETVPLGTMSPFDGGAAPEPEAPDEPQADENPFAEAPAAASQPDFPEQSEPPPPSGDVFDAPADDDTATRMIPKMSFEDLQRLQQQSAEAESAPAASESPFEEPAPEPESEIPAPPFAQDAGSAPFRIPDDPEPGIPPAEPTGPLAEESSAPDDDTSTRMIPKMSFEDLQRLQQQAAENDQNAAAETAPAFDTGAIEPPAAPEPESDAFPEPESDAFPEPESDAAEEPAMSTESRDENPFADSSEPDPQEAGAATRMIPKMSFDDLQRMQEQQQEQPEEDRQDEAPDWSQESAGNFEAAESEPSEEPPSSSWESPADESPATGSDAAAGADIDQIARRVVEMLSDKLVREIAWEVIPDIAEMVVRERVRELESEDS